MKPQKRRHWTSVLTVTMQAKRTRRWAGVWWAFDPQMGRYRRVTRVARRAGVWGRLKTLWKRIRMEENR